jgi:hypothetical protein
VPVPPAPIESLAELQRQTADSRERLSRGERLVYHVTTEFDGAAVDVRIRELPIIHLYVPDTLGAPDGARGLIARTLGVEPSSFDVVPER